MKTSVRTVALFLGLIVLSSCSSSSSTDLEPSDPIELVSAVNQDTPNSIIDPNNEQITDESTNESDENDTNVDTNETTNNNETDSNQSVPDPLANISTRVTFNITVPAYQSNTLQVRITRSNTDFTAAWIGDELWTASADFPANTESLLIITFSDNNGELILGQYESVLRTGSNDSQTYTITADLFNTEQFDNDNDGVSNLAESIAGTNPLLDETMLLDLRDTYFLQSIFLTSPFYENRIPADRPFFEFTEERPTTDFNTDRVTHVITIDIDALGTGSFSDRFRFAGAADRDITTLNQEATRTTTENSVIWSGTYERFNTGAGVGNDITFSTETQDINVSTRMQTGTVEREESGVSNGIIQTMSYNLTGTIDSETSLCTPIFGTVVNDTRFIFPSRPRTIATINKGTEDEHWAVSVVTPEGEILEEYFVRSLSATFYCDIAEI